MTPIRLYRNALVVCAGFIILIVLGVYRNLDTTPYVTRTGWLEKDNDRQSSITLKMVDKTSTIPERPDGIYVRTEELRGLVFSDKTEMGSSEGEIAAPVTISLVKSFSPGVEQHVKEMFNDDHNECIFYAIIPAMIRRGDHIEVVQRVWLGQYEKLKTKYRDNGWDYSKMANEWMNSWQENFLYHMELDSNYNLLKPGQLMGIPTTTNIKFTYKSDGPMDPRLAKIGDDTLLVFHTWMTDKNSDNQIGGRIHTWDMDRHVKKKMWPHIKLQRTEINWIPLDLNGELYFTYSIDPLRVMKCDRHTGECEFIFEQEGTAQNPFVYTSDHLRGGTPWILYKYPYYISMAHSVAVTYKPLKDFSVYSAMFVVLSVDPWRVVYVSQNIQPHREWMRSEPVIRNHTIVDPFFYPTGIIMWSDDVIDVSGHLNDASGHILRIRGIDSIMRQVMKKDTKNTNNLSSHVRVPQQYVLEATKLKEYKGKKWTFYGDIIEHTVEDPVTGEIITQSPKT